MMRREEDRAIEIVENINNSIVELGLDDRIVLSFNSTGITCDVALDDIGLWDDQSGSEETLTEEYIRKVLREIGAELQKL